MSQSISQKLIDELSTRSFDMVDLNLPTRSQLASQADIQGVPGDLLTSVQIPASDQISLYPASSVSPSVSRMEFADLISYSEMQLVTESESVEGMPEQVRMVIHPRYQRSEEGEIEEEEEQVIEELMSEEEKPGESLSEEEIKKKSISLAKESIGSEESESSEEPKAEKYTYIDVLELNATGEEVLTKKLVPKVKEEVFTKKKMVPIIVKFNRIGDGDELIEEEETVEEEMSFIVTRITVLVKQLNDKGEEVLLEKVIEKEEVIEDKKKPKKITITKILPSGEEVEEEIEVLEEQEITKKPSVASRKTFDEMHELYEEQEGMWEYQDYMEEYVDEEGETCVLKGVRKIWKKLGKEKPIITLLEDERQFKLDLLQELRKVRGKLKLYRQKNKFLSKKLCQFYKLKRKHIRDERQRIAPEVEALLRRQYHRRLLEYNEVRQFLLSERETRSNVLKNAQNMTQKLKTELEARIISFFEKQREIIKKLDPRVCKIVLRNVDFEKIIEQQLKLDKLLSEVRHNYVKKMNQFTELKQKHMQRKKVRPSNRDDDVDIVTYERLKVATRDLQDKLDIKESYILSLKEKLVHAVQTLAHVRFKNEAIDQSLDNIKKEIVDSKRELADLRNECVEIREKRTKVMKEVKKLNDKSGIMRYPMLVKDYYEIMDDKLHLAEELIKVKMMVDNQKMLLEEYKLKKKPKKDKKGVK